MEQDIGEMIGVRGESPEGIISSERKPLNRPIEIRGRCIREKEMPEPLGNQPPTADERVAQNQGRIIPDEPVPQRRSVNGKSRDNHEQDGFKIPH